MKLALSILALLVGTGCAPLSYYGQAVVGHFDLMVRARPIEERLAEQDLAPELRARLESALAIRAFASAELGLPDNGSYRSYADLQRSHVVWNVVATPEFSFKPRESCFLFVGCVSYRGYYRREDAEAFAAELRASGDEVYVYGVAAYSTLGWFDDPVLNTFIQSSSAELARLIFHELAHQAVYIKGDSMFNESFAVAVEEEGVRRWLARHASDRERAAHAIVRERRAEFVDLVLRYRAALDRVYRQTETVAARRADKRRLFAALDADYRALKADKWNGWAGYDRWFDSGANNAKIASVATYKVYVPSFRALLARHRGDMNAFYADVRRLAALDPQARDIALAAMANEPPL